MLLCAIQTFVMLYSLIRDLKKYHLEEGKLRKIVKKALIDNGIDQESADIYCKYFVENFETQADR